MTKSSYNSVTADFFMLAKEEFVKIFDNLNNEYVEAKIVPISSRHIQEIELNWKPQLKNENCWDQDLDIKQYLNADKTYEVYVLEYNSIAQGIMVSKIANCFSRLEVSKNLIYLALLTVAPWNRVSSQGRRNYKKVGTVLLKYAILHSFYLGFEGRIALHSIKSSESFFEKIPFFHGVYDLFTSENNGELSSFRYLEMSAYEAELLILDLYLTSYLGVFF